MSADNTHWLSTLAQRAGLGDSSGADLTGNTPIFEAWQTVANSLGLSQADVARGVADVLHLPVADLASADPGALKFLPERPASTYGVLPLRATDRELIVATSNPLDLDAEREIGFLSSRRTVFEVAPPDALSPAAKSAYRKAADSQEALAGEEAASDAATEAAEVEESAVAEAAELKAVTETEVIQAEPSEQEAAAELILEKPSGQEAAETELILEDPSEHQAAGAELIAEERSDQEVTGTGTELILEEASEQVSSETELVSEDVDLAPEGGLRAFARSLLKAFLGILDRLRALIGLRTEPSDSSEPALETTASPSFQQFLTKFDGETPEPETPARTDSEPETSPSEAHILIVDDAEEERLLMRTILTTNGFEVSEADDGRPALSLLQDAEGIDAILLDLQMTEMDGLETLEEIRKSEKTKALPVVILTASKDPGKERELLEAGADDYLRKPVDPLQLINRIRAVLKRAQF